MSCLCTAVCCILILWLFQKQMVKVKSLFTLRKDQIILDKAVNFKLQTYFFFFLKFKMAADKIDESQNLSVLCSSVAIFSLKASSGHVLKWSIGWQHYSVSGAVAQVWKATNCYTCLHLFQHSCKCNFVEFVQGKLLTLCNIGTNCEKRQTSWSLQVELHQDNILQVESIPDT